VTLLRVGACDECGARRFPVPLWCEVCGAGRISEVEEASGRVAEMTVLRHVPGRRLEPVRIGTVNLEGGAIVIARLGEGVKEGDSVRVTLDGGAPVATGLT
jgi:uncharacterized OB-fold protein